MDPHLRLQNGHSAATIMAHHLVPPQGRRVLWRASEGAGTARRQLLRVIGFAKSVVAMARRGYCAAQTSEENRSMTVLEIEGRPKRRSKSNGDARPTFVSAGQFARHIGCVRSYLDKLLEQGVLERRDRPLALSFLQASSRPSQVSGKVFNPISSNHDLR